MINKSYKTCYSLFEVKAYGESSIIVISKSMEKALVIAREYYENGEEITSIRASDKYILVEEE